MQPLDDLIHDAAMMAAGFHNPDVVISQLKFENWHMFQTFLAATATSA